MRPSPVLRNCPSTLRLPGTSHTITLGAYLRPFNVPSAKSLKSSKRLLVQPPGNTEFHPSNGNLLSLFKSDILEQYVYILHVQHHSPWDPGHNLRNTDTHPRTCRTDAQLIPAASNLTSVRENGIIIRRKRAPICHSPHPTCQPWEQSRVP